MISYTDQMQLFTVIGKEISKDIRCYAFGGNAMMFYGYKDETKDVDLLFDEDADRDEFLQVLQRLGFQQQSLTTIYVPEKLRDKHKPVVVKKEDGRFDLFVNRIFHTQLSPRMKEDVFSVNEFQGKYKLTVLVLRKEHLVLLKSVTERDRDFEDIVTITKKDATFDWQYFLDEVLWQAEHGNSWALLDVEKMMKELQEYLFIPEKYLKQLYGKNGQKKRE